MATNPKDDDVPPTFSKISTMDGSPMTLRNLADRQYRRVRECLSEEAADRKIETTPDPAPAPAPRINNARKSVILHPNSTRSPSPELEIVFEKISVTPAKARHTAKSEQTQRSPFPLQGRAGRNKRCRCGFLLPKLNSPLSSSPFIPQPQQYPNPNLYPIPIIAEAIVSSTTTEEEDVARKKKELEAGAMDLTVSHAAEDVDNESLIGVDNKGPDSHDDGSYELQIQPQQSSQLAKRGPPSRSQPKYQLITPNYVDYNRSPSPVSGEVFTVEVGAAVDLCSDQGLLEAAAGTGTGTRTNNINNPKKVKLSRLQDFGLDSDLFALEEVPMDTDWNLNLLNPPFTPPHDLDEHNMAGTGTDTAPCHMEITGTGSAGSNGQERCNPYFNMELPPLSFLDELEIQEQVEVITYGQ